MTDEEEETDTYQRAILLTPEQLRRAYQQPALDQFFERLAATRLAMMRKQEEGEGEFRREMNDADGY